VNITAFAHAVPHDLSCIAACFEDRLVGPDKARLVLHLADCHDCRATFAALARAPALVAWVARSRRKDRLQPRRLRAPVSARVHPRS
jgi:hypothetical protein